MSRNLVNGEGNSLVHFKIDCTCDYVKHGFCIMGTLCLHIHHIVMCKLSQNKIDCSSVNYEPTEMNILLASLHNMIYNSWLPKIHRVVISSMVIQT